MPDNPERLRRMADQCRLLAATRDTEELRKVFTQMADHYEARASRALEAGLNPGPGFAGTIAGQAGNA